MYVYKKTEPNLFTVGYYGRKWEPESDHRTSEEAAARVHYLNGGERPRQVRWMTGEGSYKVEHVGDLVAVLAVADGCGLNRPCAIAIDENGFARSVWMEIHEVKFVD